MTWASTLGLKDLAAFGDGHKVAAERVRRDLATLAVAQRAGKKAHAETIQAKISNRRKDHLHILSAIRGSIRFACIR